MASEARAMLDALMGSDRDSSVPIGTSISKGGEGDMWPRGNKKSCYDRDICPLYCAWGVDVFDLFTNTKSDLGQNPYITQEDAREEFLSLPDHEKDRLGYERMLYRKLGDLVRGCDRIVTRNKDKLRTEVAKAARARGAEGNRIDPVTEVKEEVLLETAECMADLELREEEVAKMVERLVQLDHEWKEAWKQLTEQRVVNSGEKANHGDTDGKGSEFLKEANNESAVNDVNKCELEDNLVEDVEGTKTLKLDTEEGISDQHIVNDEENNEEANTKVEVNGNDKTRIKKDSSDTYQPENTEIVGKGDIEKKKNETQTEMGALDSDKIEELKSTLYSVSSEQQKIISTLTLITSQNIMPLRENLQGLQKQLYHIRTDTSSDKTVCEISGNFMSSRDAEERIAAHYAGKQYVGWKMVRDKCRELHQKYNSVGRGSQMMNGQQRGAPYGSRGGQSGGYGPTGGGHGPPPGNGGHGDRGPPMGYQHAPSARHNDRDRRDRSRSRDRDNYSSRSQGGGGRGGNHRSPSRWERDRYPSSSNDGGGHNREYGSGRHGGRRDDRGHNRGRY